MVRLQVLPQAAVGKVDLAMQHELACAALDASQRHLAQQQDGVVVQLPPAYRVQFAEDIGGIGVPTPPQVSGERPELFLQRSDESVQGAGLAYDRTQLCCHVNQRTNLFLAEQPGFERLNDQYALQHTAVNERNSQERLIIILPGFTKVLEARMILNAFHSDRIDLLRDQSRETFVQRHPQRADTFRAQAHGGGQDQVRTVRFQQINRADVRPETPRDQGDNLR